MVKEVGNVSFLASLPWESLCCVVRESCWVLCGGAPRGYSRDRNGTDTLKGRVVDTYVDALGYRMLLGSAEAS